MPNWKKVITSGSAAALSDLTISGVTQPEIKFNGSSDTGVDFAIRATPESLDFYEPEDSNKIHMQIIDDGGVDAKFGLKIGGTSVLSSGRALSNVTGNISMFTNNSGYITNSGDTSGNAGTATALATARNIAGVSFDGSANISLNNNAITNGAGYTTNTGTVTSVGTNTGLSGTVTTSGNLSLALGNLADMTQAWTTSQDEFIVLDNGTQKRKLSSEIFGSNAFTSTTIPTNNNQLSNGAGYITGVTNISGNAGTATALASARTIAGVSFDGTANISLNNESITNGAGYTTNTGTVTQVSTGAGLDGSFTTSGTITLDLSELTDMTADVVPTTDEVILLDNGAERRKRFSEIFGSNAYNSTTIPTNNNQLTNGAGYITSFTNTVDMGDGFVIEDGDGTEVTITENKEIKFVEGGGIDINFTDTSTGSDGDPFDLTFTVQTLNQDTTGNAATATTLATARNIAGVSFDGSANISLNNNAITNGAGYTTNTGTTTPSNSQTFTNKGGNISQWTNDSGYITSFTNTVDMGDGFVMEDGDGTEVTITENKEVKFVEGGGIDINWTDTSNGSDGDPYDLTFTVQTLNQNTTGTAAGLTTGRTFRTNLASTSTATFDGTGNVTPGVTGTLAVGNGGTGLTSISTLLNSNTTATNVGLGNVTNESKSTMFSGAALTNNPTAPTQAANNDSTRIATTAYVQAELTALIGTAPSTLDTLGELSASLATDISGLSALTTTVGTKLAKSSNLSDLADASTARDNLGLGTIATKAYTTSVSNGSGAIPDGDAVYDHVTTRINGLTSNTGTVTSVATGTGLTGGTITSTGTISLSHLGFESLSDPNDDRIVFWDDSATALKFLDIGTGLSISGTTISVGTLNQDTSGNAGTATALATARTIAGVSFDGSANISLNNNAITNGAGYITSQATRGTLSIDTDDRVTFTGVTASGGFHLSGAIHLDGNGLDLGNTDLKFGQYSNINCNGDDGSTGQLLARGTYGQVYLSQSSIAAGTAATLASARTIAGVSFDGSANISLNNNAITNGAGYTTNTGDITGVSITTGNGISGGTSATSGNFSSTLAINVLSLTDMTQALNSSDSLIVHDNSAMAVRRKTINELDLSQFDNSTSGFTTNTGTLTGNGTSGRVPIYNGTTSFTTDSGFTYSSNKLGIDGVLTANGVDIISNASSANALIIGDTAGGDEIDTITFSCMAGTNMTMTDGETEIGGGTSFKLPSVSNQASEATALMINSSNVVGKRELGSNAFTSTTHPTLANGSDNRVVTATSSTGLNGESNLTYNGSTLTVNGHFRAGVGAVSQPGFAFTSRTDSGMYLLNTHDLAFSVDGTQRAFLNDNGLRIDDAIGVNIDASTTDGRIDAGNDIIAYSSSDKRWKENIKPIKNALDKVLKIGGYEFDWKELTEEEKKTQHGNEGHDIGVIAQEVEKVLPEVVTTRENGFKGVKYDKMVALLIESIKELKSEIEELKRGR